jgi:thioredoxin-like negative regulator of GroEL
MAVGWLQAGMGLLTKLFGPAEPKVWPVHIDDQNFMAEVRRSSLPVLLDVWSPGCAPCKQMESIVFRLAKRYQGRVKVAEINAAGAPHTMRKLFVNGTPTIIYFKKGQEVERVVGLRGELYHQEFIDHELLEGEQGDVGAEKQLRTG